MALELTGLAIVNAGYLLVGAAAFAAAGWLTRSPATWPRLGVAFPVGLVLVTAPASYLALAGVPVSITASVVGAGVVVLAVVRCRPRPRLSALLGAAAAQRRRPSPGGVAAICLGGVLAVLLAYGLRTFVTRPFIEWDSWVIWLAKARLLYADPSLAPAALRSGDYGQTAYPLGLPTIEALGFSAMGRFDGPVAVSRDRRRVRPAATALAALAVLVVPWRVYCSVYGLSTPDYDLGNAVRPSYLSAHADRLGPTVHELWRQLVRTPSWGLLAWVIVVGLLAALVSGRWRVAGFALTWLALACGGLLLTYWISVLPVSSHLTNTSYRTIVSLLVGGAALVPLLAFPVSRPPS